MCKLWTSLQGKGTWAFLLACPEVGQKRRVMGRTCSQHPDNGVKWSYILEYFKEFTENPLELINDLEKLQGTRSIYKKSIVFLHIYDEKSKNKIKKIT